MGGGLGWDTQKTNIVSDPIYLCLTPFISKELVIRLSGKNELPVIAALDDVLRLAGYNVTGKARHECLPEMG